MYLFGLSCVGVYCGFGLRFGWVGLLWLGLGCFLFCDLLAITCGVTCFCAVDLGVYWLVTFSFGSFDCFAVLIGYCFGVNIGLGFGFKCLYVVCLWVCYWR